jgi:RNA polymerase sigma factor (sigma-70 family)
MAASLKALPGSRPMDTTADPLIAYLEAPTRERFAPVVEAYSALVWGIAYRTTRHPEDAEDICQDVFLHLIVRPPADSGVRSARAFLAWLVLSRVDHLRRAARRRIEREEEAANRFPVPGST